MSEQRPKDSVIVYDILALQHRVWEMRVDLDNLGSLPKWVPETKEWQSAIRSALQSAADELWRMARELGFSEEVLSQMDEDMFAEEMANELSE